MPDHDDVARRVAQFGAAGLSGDEALGLVEVAKAMLGLVDYRRRVGPVGFQLEKADDFIRLGAAALGRGEEAKVG